MLLRNGKDPVKTAKAACEAGADIIQFRFNGGHDSELIKTAVVLKKAISSFDKILLINNRADIAKASCADGVHLGRNDIDVKTARIILGKKALIGKTVHSLKELAMFNAEDTDYWGIGPYDLSELKPDLKPLGVSGLKKIIKNMDRPYFVIGNINLNNLTNLINNGITNIVVCRAIIEASSIFRQTEKIKQCITKTF
ncbi:MAG: thiamine phosphate synthase [Candidatus Omnitrophica bacterium]|nr:thiamine phosphate synthase [Candidatus Omnitrophota bacterium]MDD5081242.1 thiamine phosphate synthase [Candidatus Omnitrophota bacterium]MDD5441313.1 thiamine phosphate synthase [Candidatus Omnitrophota bacterium]